MPTIRLAAVLPLLFAVLAPSAYAIHVEPDQPDLKNPKTQLVEATRAAEQAVNGDGGATSISASNFTGFNDAVKRKPFPPGFGRSGYQFEDELIGPAPSSAATPEEGAQDQSPARKP